MSELRSLERPSLTWWCVSKKDQLSLTADARPQTQHTLATMANSGSQRQIKQMVNFITQEAKEKANEIRIKTEHDFNLEKQMLVHNAKLKIQEEYEKKEKNRETEKRIKVSADILASRKAKMVAREELMKSLIVEARQNVSKVTKDSGKYGKLLQQLIVQALVKLDETDVIIYCRAADTGAVKKVMAGAQKDYLAVMKKECGEDVKLKLTLNEQAKKMLPDSRLGGVFLTGFGGRLTCDNTLEARLNLIYEEEKPTVRQTLFGVA